MEIDYSEIRRQLEKYHNVQSLMQYVNENTLLEKHKKLNGAKATGIDKVTKEIYNSNKEQNIKVFVEKMKKFSYKPNMNI